MRLAGFAALLGCLAAPAAAKTIAPGIYGNVRQSAVTGDLGGTELEVIGRGPNTRVEFVYCEGWCNEVIRTPVKLTRRGFTFAYAETLHDEQGQSVKGERHDIDVSAAGSGIRISMRIGGRPFATSRLERLHGPFGLAVARKD
jgi:hypothetical protein